MKISVIIAARNERANIDATLATLRGTGVHEVIIVDDASEPAHEIKPKDAKDCLVIGNEDHMGVGFSRQVGSMFAKGDVLVFTDAHMRFPPDWVRKMEAGLTGCGEMSLISSTYVPSKPFPPEWWATIPYPPCRDFGGAIMKHYAVKEDKFFNFAYMEPLPARCGGTAVPVPCVVGACYGIYRDWFTELGGFQGLRGYGADEQLLSWKVWLAGGQVCYLPELLVIHMDQTHRKVKVHKLLTMLNCLYTLRVVFDSAWPEFVENLSWYFQPLVQDVQSRYWPTFSREHHPDEISERFGLQTIAEAIDALREDTHV